MRSTRLASVIILMMLHVMALQLHAQDKKYFVSAKGDDNNDGLSPNKSNDFIKIYYYFVDFYCLVLSKIYQIK